MAKLGDIHFVIRADKINDLMRVSLLRTIERSKHAHYTDVSMRINGNTELIEADWIKHLEVDLPPELKVM